MSIPGAGNPLLLGGAGGYKIERSLRFNSADSAYLRRTPASAGNRKTWTWSGWVKRCEFGAALEQVLHGAFVAGGGTQSSIGFLNDALSILFYNGTVYRSSSTALFRDPSAWYHIVFAIDTTQASTSDRCKVYVNGAQITMSAWTVPQNTDTLINAASQSHDIGTLDGGTYYKFNGYLADIHFIDGQALTPSSFGETDVNGIWQPKAYSGSYGTNGFQLKFADNSAATATTLGKDTSGNGNNWTPNNLSVTAGAGNDSLVDSPTNYGTDTGAGAEVRGNYATLNPISTLTTVTLANGNLDYSSTTASKTGIATIGMSSGKWYWEVVTTAGTTETQVGVYGTSASTLYSLAANSTVYGIRFDADAGTLDRTSDGTNWTSIATGLTLGPYFPYFNNNGTTAKTVSANFGQRPFAYTAPSGFKALCTQNLPAPTITKPNTVMDVALWTGNGSARSITGLGFNPDLVWIKGRSGATDHALYDSVRGTEKRLESNNTDSEVTSDGGVTAFNSDGFSLGTLAQLNTNADTYAGWAWDAGSSTVTNTSGTISSQVRANASAGFSVATFIGGASAYTVGHGLNVAPSLIMMFARDGSIGNYTYHVSVGNGSYLKTSSTAAATAGSHWNNTSPTSSVFSVGAALAGGYSWVAYCFAPVAGYSAFGSYTGNGSADGPMVFTNMRPRWIMLKRTNSTSNWTIIDTAREGYNVDNDPLYPNLSNAEGTTDLADILSNGFKLRSTDASVNANTGTYVYACFAESPFALARAR